VTAVSEGGQEGGDGEDLIGDRATVGRGHVASWHVGAGALHPRVVDGVNVEGVGSSEGNRGREGSGGGQ